MNTPLNLNQYRGHFVVFFPEETTPRVLFHSIIAEDAYTYAKKLGEKRGRQPIVYRVQENEANNLLHILTAQA